MLSDLDSDNDARLRTKEATVVGSQESECTWLGEIRNIETVHIGISMLTRKGLTVTNLWRTILKESDVQPRWLDHRL